jgi:hypothetical protein
MVQKIECRCNERYETKINSIKLFKEIILFFECQVYKHIFDDVIVEKPFYVGNSELQTLKWYATKWYKCKVCGCLWEFNYPDFPSKGFVRKFKDGQYNSPSFLHEISQNRYE